MKKIEFLVIGWVGHKLPKWAVFGSFKILPFYLFRKKLFLQQKTQVYLTIYSKNVRVMTANSKTKLPDPGRLCIRILDPNIRLHILSKKNFPKNFYFFFLWSIFKPKNEPKLGFAQIKN